MATKTLNTRLQMRYDSFAQWTAVNPVLLKGEIAIANAPANAGSGMTEPAILIKVGDNASHYNDLPFITAKAGDVLEACKTEAALKTFIGTVIADAGLTDNDAFKALNDAVELLNGDATKVGSVANSIKTAVEALDFTDTAVDHEFITSVSEADGVISVTRAQPEIADVNGLQNALDVKQDNLVFMTTYNKDTNKVATAADLTKVADDASAEIASKISSTYKAAGTVANVDALPAASVATLGFVYNLTAAGTTTADFVEGAGKAIPEGANIVVVEIPGENEGDPATYKFDVLSGMVDLSDYAKTTEVTAAITNAIEALDYTDTSVDHQFISEVQEVDGIISVVRKALVAADIPALASDKITDIETKVVEVVEATMTPGTDANPNTNYDDIAKLVADIVAKELAKVPAEGETNNFYDSIETIVEKMVKDALTPAEGETDSPVLEAVNTAVDAKIGALDYEDTAVDGQFVTQVSEVDGVIAVVRKAITTGDVTGLETEIQTVIKESLTKPTVADPDNPTADEQAALTLYNEIMKEVTKLVNKALTGTGTDSTALVTTIETIIKDAILDAGVPDADPAVPASEVNQAINTLINNKVNALDFEHVAETGKAITGIKQEDGKIISVTTAKMASNVNDLEQTAGDELILDCGGANLGA